MQYTRDDECDLGCAKWIILLAALLVCVGMAVGHYSGITYAMRMMQVRVQEDKVILTLNGEEWRHFL